MMRLIKKISTINQKNLIDLKNDLEEQLHSKEIINISFDLLETQGKIWGEFSQNKVKQYLNKEEIEFLNNFNRYISIRFIYNTQEKSCTSGVTSIGYDGEFHIFNYSPNDQEILKKELSTIIKKIKENHKEEIESYICESFYQIIEELKQKTS